MLSAFFTFKQFFLRMNVHMICQGTRVIEHSEAEGTLVGLFEGVHFPFVDLLNGSERKSLVAVIALKGLFSRVSSSPMVRLHKKKVNNTWP